MQPREKIVIGDASFSLQTTAGTLLQLLSAIIRCVVIRHIRLRQVNPYKCSGNNTLCFFRLRGELVRLATFEI